ncbi:hypothetical protein C7S17_4710 [Burkholderia thailandensis]|nr:hypothetical protein [Burkholderia thailandensis]
MRFFIDSPSSRNFCVVCHAAWSVHAGAILTDSSVLQNEE